MRKLTESIKYLLEIHSSDLLKRLLNLFSYIDYFIKSKSKVTKSKTCTNEKMIIHLIASLVYSRRKVEDKRKIDKKTPTRFTSALNHNSIRVS